MIREILAISGLISRYAEYMIEFSADPRCVMNTKRIFMSLAILSALCLTGCTGGGPDSAGVGSSVGGGNIRLVEPGPGLRTLENILLFQKFRDNRTQDRQPDFIGFAIIAAPTNGPLIDGLLVITTKGKVRHAFLATPTTRIKYGTIPVSFSFIIPRYDVVAVTVNDRKRGLTGKINDFNMQKGNNIQVAQTIRLLRP